MQIFGKYKTNFDMDYLTEHYIYFNRADESITTQDLEMMLKKKRKHVAGTIFLYHPETSPKGYKPSKFLQEDGFEAYDEFVELNEDPMSFVLNAGLKHTYEGKLVEVKYLFNYNEENIRTSKVDEFEMDLEKLKSRQLTRHDKELNYIDIPNIRLSGKFVFFGIGHKYDREHTAINYYARDLTEHIKKLDKQIVFIYDKNHDDDEAMDIAYFISPLMSGKNRELVANAFKEVFAEIPPKRVRI
ncbi:MAG: hypothetical protein ABXS93_03915 [Sulfurimonas sp.]